MIEEQEVYYAYTANGVTSQFAYGCRIFAPGDLVVKVAGVTKALAVDYTISGVDDVDGGTVTFLPGHIPASGVVELERVLEYSRTSGYAQNGDFRPETVDRDQDYQTALLQQQAYHGSLVAADILAMKAIDISLQEQINQQAYNVAGQFIKTSVSASSFGPDLQDAITAIGANNATLVVDSFITVNADAAVHANTSLVFIRPGSISIAAGKTLTVNGPFEAGLFRVFTGDGDVSGLGEARPEHFGGVPDGVWVAGADLYGANETSGQTCTGTDSTLAITRVVAAVATRGGIVRFSAGTYLASALPWDSGIRYIGVGTKKTAVGGGATSGTVLKQINGTNADFITTPSASSWIESASIENIRFIGDPTGAATTGSGLVVKKRLGENTRLSNVRFDYFPEHGVKLERGVQPGTLNDVQLFWNGYRDIASGSGLYITRDVTDLLQSGAFSNISGDSNKAALIYVKGGSDSSNIGGGLAFNNIKSEIGVSGTQQNTFVFDGCIGLAVQADNVNAITTNSPETTGNAVFKIIGASVPKLTWNNVSADQGINTGIAYILDDAVNSKTFAAGSSSYKNGVYNVIPVNNSGLRFENHAVSAGVTVLDYYKEGTFTPVAVFSGTAQAFNAASGKYTRIGNLVHFTLFGSFSAMAGTGSFSISGLPFAPVTNQCAVSIRATSLAAGVGDTFLEGLINNSTSVVLYKIAAGVATQLAAGDLTTTTAIVITGHYFTDAA